MVIEQVFEAGEKYRVVKSGYDWQCDTLSVGFEFTVSTVDFDGYCWSEDVPYGGLLLEDGEGWRVCSADVLHTGFVELTP